MREDKLPQPTTVGELYLSAILDEVRIISASIVKTIPIPPQTDSSVLRVKEPVLNTPEE